MHIEPGVRRDTTIQLFWLQGPFILPILSGLLFWLSSQAFSFPLGVWFCLVPLGFSLYRTTPARGAVSGLVYGFCFWFVSVWWLKFELINLVHLVQWQAWGWTVLFCVYHAVPYTIFGYLAAKYCILEQRYGAWLAAAFLVVIRSWFPHVFPGGEANSLYAVPQLIQVVDLGGTPLLQYSVYLVNFLFAGCVIARGEGKPYRRSLAAIAVIFVLITGYGVTRLQQLHKEMQAAPPNRQITVVSVQPNVPIHRNASDFPLHDRNNDMSSALRLAREAALKYRGADLVALPEVPLGYSCSVEAVRDLPPLVKESGIAFLVPCTGLTGDTGGYYYNSALYVNRDGLPSEQYNKLVLTPFGEYLPLENHLTFLRTLFPGVMSFRPGTDIVLYDVGAGKKVIPALCYEAMFSAHCRKFVDRGGTVLVNMVNDAWFGASKASLAHLSVSVFRSIEFRIPMVRVTNSGIGIFVQPTGEIVPGSRTPLFEKALTSYPLYIPEQRSLYAQWGDLFLYGLTVICAMYIIRLIFTQRG